MTMSSDIIGIASLDLQGIAVLLGGVSAYCIWRQLTALALAGQANVSERLASQSFGQSSVLRGNSGQLPREHIVLQRPSLPRASREAWVLYVRDHYNATRVGRNSLPTIATGMPTYF